jgi:FKBP-type peptidyl-prolyl cis-trans isomerase (trigger factor)
VVISSIPESIIRQQEKSLINYFEGLAEQVGMDFDFLFLNFYIGVEDEEGLLEAYHDDIISDARSALIVQAIAENEGMVITEADVEDMFGDFDLPGLIEEFGLPFIKQHIITQRVFELIMDGVVLE